MSSGQHTISDLAGTTRVRNLLRRPYRLARRGASRAVLPLRRRRIDVCCCGLSKTGTHSMAGIFGSYRSAHHPDGDIRLPLAMAYLQGEVDNADAQRILERRDRRFRLEMESSALSGILIEPLARACPTKRFILTIRDVYSWCDSWIDHNITHPADAGSPWTALDEIRLRAKEIEPTRLDAPLVARGFPSLACFFRLWAEHNARVLEAVETDRLLVVRTHEITEQIPEIAAWAGVRAETLRVDQSWLFAAPEKHDVLSTLDERYVRETADRFCSALMAAYFPEMSWGTA